VAVETRTWRSPAWLERLRGDVAANTAFFAVIAGSIVVFVVVGREQWFTRDDWAFVLTRIEMREQQGIGTWLFTAQDGHWMTAPLLVYGAIQAVFGIDSYWPFLVPTMALHVGAVLLLRQICRRVDATAWTTTLICTLMLLFGNGWENIVFAVQITYNLSLVAFFAQLLLVDHEGDVDRRDVIGAGIGVIGVMSSAFGPFFAVGMFTLLAMRRRWKAVLVAIGPQAVVYAWWLLTWATDPAGDAGKPSPLDPFRFARITLSSTLGSMAGQFLFAGAALLGIIGVVWWSYPDRRRFTLLAVLAVLPVPIFLAIGWQRVVFGFESAPASRYQYMAAMLFAAPLAVAVDQLRRFNGTALFLGRAVLVLSILLNTRVLVRSSDDWADRAAEARLTFELVAGSPLVADVAPTVIPVPFDPDVTVGRLPGMVADRAIEPRPPVTPEEIARVRAALGLDPAGG
jgi:hypothetical protein